MTHETKHTPGPLVAELANANNPNGIKFWCVVMDRAPGHRDAVCNMGWFNQGILPHDEANAHLFAAAPELLKIAETASVWATRHGYVDALREIHAVLAKAEGRQP